MQPGHVRIGARTSWAAIGRARTAALLRSLEGGRMRSRLGSDPGCRDPGRQSLQCFARRRQRAAAPGARCRGRADLGLRATPPSASGVHPRQPPHRLARRRDHQSRCSCRARSIGSRSAFLKLGARRYLVISIAMVAAIVEADEAGRVERARVAVGACSEVAQRLPALEAALLGAPAQPGLGARVGRRMSRPWRRSTMCAPRPPIASTRRRRSSRAASSAPSRRCDGDDQRLAPDLFDLNGASAVTTLRPRRG